MTQASPNLNGPYRRRILGWGLITLVVAFVIGAMIAVPWVHDDLENRVGNTLSAAGIDGVSVSFSGQDGTLTCDAPLADPTAAGALASEVYGVRRIDLGDGCEANGSSQVDGDTPTTSPAPNSAPAADRLETSVPVVTGAPDTTPLPTAAPPVTEPRIASIAGIAAQDPQFSQFADLLEMTGLDELLASGGPFTVLAPTDDAFDATFEQLGADGFNDLTSDSDLVRQVLLHHVVDSTIPSSAFIAGPLEMSDGTTIDVDPTTANGVTFTSGGLANGTPVVASIDDGQVDIEASNGVIHGIDQVLIPAGLVLPVDEPAIVSATTSATLENGQLTFVGAVSSEAQRQALIDTGVARIDAANVIDQLTVDPSLTIDGVDLDRLVRTIGAMPSNLVSGTATLTGSELVLVGVHAGSDANATLQALGVELGAAVSIEARAGADDTSAQQLQDELNTFVSDNPILFESNSAVLTADANAVVEQVAARAQRFEGVAITIIGHTDSDGDPVNNLVLSEARAATVLGELVRLGVVADTLNSEGRGVTEPILGLDGVEDKTASRRVEFLVVAQSP